MSMDIQTLSHGTAAAIDSSMGLRAASGHAAYRGVDLNTRQEILAIQDKWQRLELACSGSTVFQAFDLCLPWLDAYVFCDTPTHRAHVLAFYDDAGTLVALAPFAQRIDGFMTMAEWIGEPLVQYGDMLMRPGCDLQRLRRALSDLLGSWTVSGMHLRNVRDDARVHQLLDLDKARLGETREAGMVDLTKYEDSDSFFNSFSAKSKKNQRKKRRVLSERGTLRHRALPAGREAEDLCDLAIRWKVAWLTERGLSSRAFMDARALQCLRDVCGRKSAENPIQVFVQTLDEEPIAIEIGLVGAQGNAAFMGTYRPDMESLSPGKVQMGSTISHGFEQGWETYDMLAPMSAYKESWCNHRVGVADYMMPTGLDGLAYRDVWLRRLRPASKALWYALPASVRGLALRKGGLSAF